MTVGKLTSLPLMFALVLQSFIDIAGALVVRGDGSGFFVVFGFFGFFLKKVQTVCSIKFPLLVLFRKKVCISDFELIPVQKGH